MDSLNEKGFTLVEIAIVMVIIGLLAGGGISLMRMLSERKARNETIDYLKEVDTAVVSFANINGRLPWADTDGDGNENTGAVSGDLPCLTLGLMPTDSHNRVLKYALNSNLATDRPTSCNALRAGLSGSPRVVDFDGPTASFSVATILISAGPMDADGDGNVFDDKTSGSHQGDNRDGIPNYLRHPPLQNTFDDLVAYIGGNRLYGEICGNPVLTVRNTSPSPVYVYDQPQGTDVGIVDTGDTNCYDIISGTRIELRSAAGGGGAVVPSTPPTPIILAGSGRSITIP